MKTEILNEVIKNALNAKVKGGGPEITIYRQLTRYTVPFNGSVLGDYITVKYGENYGFDLTIKDGIVVESYDTIEEVEYALTGSYGILRGRKSLGSYIRVPSKEEVKKKLALGKRLRALNAERKKAREIGAVIEKVNKSCPTEDELKNAIKKAKEFLKSVGEI